MKGTFILLAVLLTSSAEATVIIRGKILSYDGKSKVSYCPTIEGIHTPYWKEITPSSNGVFVIEFENSGIGTTTVFFQKLHFRFIHQSNSKIYFEFDQSKITSWKGYLQRDSVRRLSVKEISGDHAAVNNFYNNSLRTSISSARVVDGNIFSRAIRNASTPQTAIAAMDSMVQKELSQIDALMQIIQPENSQRQPSPEELDFLKNEVRAFYGTNFLSAMFLRRYAHVAAHVRDSTSTDRSYGESWEKIIEKFFEEARQLTPQPASPDYNELILSLVYARTHYQRYSFPQSGDPDSLVAVGMRVDTTLIRNEKAQLAYLLSMLQVYVQSEMFYSPALLNAINELETNYPTSKNLAFYKPQIEKVKKSVEMNARDFNEGRIIRRQYSSFSKLLEEFSGSNLLVDVWATWCGPCIQDFRHKASLQPYIESGRLSVLFISIDKPAWEDRWRQSIKYNELNGNHYRADQSFIEDMWRTLGGFEGRIPRYALVNKTGKIVIPDASRPGSEALLKEIEQLLKE